MKIELDNYNALAILSFLMEFEDDFKDREDCRTIRGAIQEYAQEVCTHISEDELRNTINQQLAADRLLGWVPKT